jgi:hypothetical protein
VSIEQKENLDAIMRQSAFPLDEATAALDRAGQLLSAHLAAADTSPPSHKAERKGWRT